MGSVQIMSNNSYDDPLIDYNILHDSNDFEDMLKMIYKALEFGLSPQFRRYATLFNTTIPGCEPCHPYSNHDNQYSHILCDSYLKCVIRMVTKTMNELSGTCRMGSSHDPNAVTDERLRVIKVQSLRVIDASIVPRIIRGNTNAVAIMIAEKGSQMIKDDHRLK